MIMSWILKAMFTIEDPDDYSDDWKRFRPTEAIWRPSFFGTGIGTGVNLTKYCRALQCVYEKTVEILGDNYLYDVAMLREKYNSLLYENEALRIENAVLSAKLGIQEEKTEIALDMSSKTDKKNLVLEENGYETIDTSAQPREGNKFSSPTGNKKIENQKVMAAMSAFGISVNDIAKDMKVGIRTVNTYLSAVKGHYHVFRDNGRTDIIFDQMYGEDRWSLDDMFGDEWKPVVESNAFAEDENQLAEAVGSDLSSDYTAGGVIHKKLIKPVF